MQTPTLPDARVLRGVKGTGQVSVPALALAPVLIDPRTGTGANVRTLNDELLDRAARDDYHPWLAGTTATGGCVRPVRLRGTIRDLDPATGEILRTLDTDTLPDKVIYTPCGDRRASVCPACAETYRRDTYQLIRAGLTGGKGIPETVRAHPCVFATFTAPGFGPVHTRRQLPGGRAAQCRPRRKTTPLPARPAPVLRPAAQRHRPRPRAGRCARTATTTRPPSSGTPTPPNCGAGPPSPSAASWPAPPKLPGPGRCSCPMPRWRSSRPAAWSTSTPSSASTPPPTTASWSRPPSTPRSWPPPSPRPPRSTWFATVAHPARPKGWDIRWGAQLDTRTIRLPGHGTARSPTSPWRRTWRSTPRNRPRRSAPSPAGSPLLTCPSTATRAVIRAG